MKYNIKFDLVKSTGLLSPLRARISYNSKRIDLRLGYSLPNECWNPELQFAKHKQLKDKQLCLEVNQAIRDFKTKVDELFTKCEVLNNSIPTVEQITNIIKHKTQSKITLIDLLQMYSKENTNLEDSTYRGYIAVIKKFEAFAGDNIAINQINQDVIIDFQNYLTYVVKFKNSTLKNYLLSIKTLLKFATKKKLYDSDLNIKSKFKFAQKEIIYLETDELKKINDYQPYKPMQQEIKNQFLFCCFTGLRFSDMQKLTWDHVFSDCITVVTKKTFDPLKIELNNYSKAILAYQKQVSNSNFVFKHFFVNQYNQELRKICYDCKIDSLVSESYYVGNNRIEKTEPKWRVISSHSGRKTFVVNCIKSGIPLEVVTKWTGHKDFEAIKPYLKIVDEVKNVNMQKLNDVL